MTGTRDGDTAELLPWRAGTRGEIMQPGERGRSQWVGWAFMENREGMRSWGGELVLAGRREGFDLLSQVRSDAITQETHQWRRHQCKNENKIKTSLKKPN